MKSLNYISESNESSYSDIYFLKSLVYKFKNDRQKMLELLNKSLALNEQNERALEERALEYFFFLEYDKANSDIQKLGQLKYIEFQKQELKSNKNVSGEQEINYMDAILSTAVGYAYLIDKMIEEKKINSASLLYDKGVEKGYKYILDSMFLSKESLQVLSNF